jgi:hypothetical protein
VRLSTKGPSSEGYVMLNQSRIHLGNTNEDGTWPLIDDGQQWCVERLANGKRAEVSLGQDRVLGILRRGKQDIRLKHDPGGGSKR